jgi:hypothetical protein
VALFLTRWLFVGKITYNKGMLAYPYSVIAMKPLLVADRSYHGGVLHLLGPLLIIEVDAQSAEVKVGGDDCLNPIDEEEGVYPIEPFMLVCRLQSKEGSSSTHRLA